MKKLILLVAVGIGYVLGARAGRERYEQIKKWPQVKDDPQVQSAASTVADTAKQQAPVVKDKVVAPPRPPPPPRLPIAVRLVGSDDEDELLDQLDPDSTARQDNPYPQGNLP